MSKSSSFALRGMAGNLTWTSRTTTAWYELAPVRWGFRAVAEAESILTAAASGWAQLAGRRVHMRVTAAPYQVSEWAQALDADTRDPLPAWRAHLVAEQRHLLGLTINEKRVFVGVELAGKAAPNRLPGWLPSRPTGRDAQSADLREVTAIMAAPGFDAHPVTTADLEWLLHRSVGLGHPAPLTLPGLPQEWAPEDLPEVTDRASWTAEPYGRTVRISAEVDGHLLSRHVCVMTLGRMADLDIPRRHEPWQQTTDRLPFDAEWVGTVDVLGPERVSRDMADAMARIRSQVEHFAEHRLDPPLGLARQRSRALQVEDEVTSSTTGLATRGHGWFRVAVSGADETEALDRARQLRELYAPAITMVRTADQFRAAREFLPGEPLANVAHKRRLPVLTMAAGMPAATAMVGDRDGMYLGYTCGASERAVFWSTHRAQEVRERSGLTLIAGGLGSGKSTLVGAVVYRSVLAGVPWVVLDPSGPLARLCELPELAPYAKHVDLMNAAPGSLNPYRVIAPPNRDHFASDEDWRRAQDLAAAQRRSLCADVLSMLLPAQVDAMPQTRMVLLRAVRAVGGNVTASPRQVIDALRHLDGSLAEQADTVADFLAEAAAMPSAQLIFPDGYRLDYATEAEPLLTVLTLQGIVLPKEGTARADWSIEEQFSVPLLHLAAHLTTRSVYSGNMHARKGVAFDETHALARVSSGRALLNQTARDSRKFNVRALFSSQSSSDFLSSNVGNLIDASFIGRTEDEVAQADALRLLRIPLGVGYESVLAGLSPRDRRDLGRTGVREFLFADGDGGIEKVRIDLSGTPSLATALDTTADPVKAAPRKSAAA